jgi:hypothetical protein
MSKNMKLIFTCLFTCFLLLGCSNEEDEAKKLGFSNVEEMKKFHSEGWHSKERYNEDLAKSKGFKSFQEMVIAEEQEKQRIEAQLKAEKEEMSRPWSKNLDYFYFEDGSCTPRSGMVCMSPRQFERACKESVGVSSGSISTKAVNSYGDEKVLLQGGRMVNEDISYGRNRQGQMVCTVRITMEGIVRGNSSRVEISGNASKFVTDSNGRLLVGYFGY